MSLGTINYSKPRLPSWGGVSNPATINGNATTPQEYQASVSGEGAVIPVVYGNVEVGVKIVDIKVYSSYLCMIGVLAEGEIESIDSFKFNGNDLNSTTVPKLATSTNDLEGDVYITKVYGTETQNSLYNTVILPSTPFYTVFNNGTTTFNGDKMRGTAYIVICARAGRFNGFPQVTALIKGKKIHRPEKWIDPDAVDMNNTFIVGNNQAPSYGVKTCITETGIADIQTYMRYTGVGTTQVSMTSYEENIYTFAAPSESYTVDIWARSNGLSNSYSMAGASGIAPVELFVTGLPDYNRISDKVTLNGTTLSSEWRKFTVNVTGAARGTLSLLRFNHLITQGKTLIDVGPIIITPKHVDDGQCVWFNDATSGGTVLLPNDSRMMDYTTAFTVEAWIWMNSFNTASSDWTIIRRDPQYFLKASYTNGPGLAFRVGTTGAITWAFDNYIGNWENKWHHVAGVFDNGNLYLYVDGEVKASGTIGSTIIAATTTVGYIASNAATDQWFNGKISNVRIWNTARTQIQLVKGMYTEVSPADPSLVMNLPLTQKPLELGFYSYLVASATDEFFNNITMNGVGTAAIGYYRRYRSTQFIFSPTETDLYIRARTFDGNTANAQHVSIPVDGTVNDKYDAAYINSSYTVESWVKIAQAQATAAGIFDWAKDTGAGYNTNRKAQFVFASGALIWQRGSSGGLVNLSWTPPATFWDKWQHVAGTYDDANLRLYWNGSLVASTACPVGTVHSGNVSAGMRIGTLLTTTYQGTYAFGGVITEFRFWNTCRTDTEIASYYRRAAMGTEANLIGCFLSRGICGIAAGSTIAFNYAKANPTNGTYTAVSGNGPEVAHGLRLLRGASVEYSNNPANCLADFITSTKYGAAKLVNWQSVVKLGVLNDSPVPGVGTNLVYGTTPGTTATDLKHRKIDIVIDKSNSSLSWVETLRTYAGCFVHPEGNTLYLIPNYATATHPTPITPDLMLKGSLTLKKSGIANNPNSVEIQYTDTTSKPWRTVPVTASSVGVNDSIKSSSVSLPGITRYGQAIREANERLKAYFYCDLAISFSMPDDGLTYAIGDVVQVKHLYFDYPWSSGTGKLFRITNITKQDAGRYGFSALEYNSTVYENTSYIGSSDIPDTNNGNPFVADTPSSLTATEDIIKGDNGQFYTRLNISWGAPADISKVGGYVVDIIQTGGALRYDSTGGLITGEYTVYTYDVTSPAVTSVMSGILAEQYTENGLTKNNVYTINVRSKNALNTLSLSNPRSIVGKILIGKTVPPTAPSSFSIYEVAGEVRLSWSPSYDLDLAGYWLAYSPTTVNDFTAATTLNKLNALRYVTTEISPGTYKFWIVAYDSGGRTSTATTAIAEVTSDAGAFSLDNRSMGESIITTSGGSTAAASGMSNMVYMRLGRNDIYKRYISQDSRAFTAVLSSAVGTYVNALATHHESMTSRWRPNSSDYIDMGSPLSGTWSAKSNYSSLPGCGTATSGTTTAGVVGAYIELADSVSASTWIQFALGGKKDTGRYARLNYSLSGQDTLYVICPENSIKIDAIPVEESGLVTGSSFTSGATTGMYTVVLANKYASTKEISLTPKSTGASDVVIARWDNVKVNSLSNIDYLEFHVKATATPCYAYATFPYTAYYQLSTGDILSYETYIDPAYPASNNGTYLIGGFDFGIGDTSGGAVTVNLRDYNTPLYRYDNDARISNYGGDGVFDGYSVWGPGTEAVGKWLKTYVVIPAGLNGKWLRVPLMVMEKDSTEEFKVFYRDIKLEGPKGTTKNVILATTGNATSITRWASGGYVQYHDTADVNYGAFAGAPSPRFTIWCTNGSGAGVARDVYWKFKGI